MKQFLAPKQYPTFIGSFKTKAETIFNMPVEMETNEENFNEGASTSAALTSKQEKKKNQPWIEKFRPQKFEEIMGKKYNI